MSNVAELAALLILALALVAWMITRYTRDGLGTHATCTVLPYPERSAT